MIDFEKCTELELTEMASKLEEAFMIFQRAAAGSVNNPKKLETFTAEMIGYKTSLALVKVEILNRRVK